MILDHDKANGRVALSTKTLEPTPGTIQCNISDFTYLDFTLFDLTCFQLTLIDLI